MSLSEVYTPKEFNDSYNNVLQTLKQVNFKIRQEGILAPSTSSVENTLFLYNYFGRPLDKIPCIHCGGTNGKVNVQMI